MSWNHTITDIPRVTVTRTIPANVEKCWAIMRVFNEVPGLPKETITAPPDETRNFDQVGYVRMIKLPAADLDIVETLRSHGKIVKFLFSLFRKN